MFHAEVFGHDAPTTPHTVESLASVSAPGESPKVGRYGCIILEDGTTYTLRHQHTHGMLLAVLLPELAAQFGYAPPDNDSSVYHYQGFELDHQAVLPAVRIAISGLTQETYVSKSDATATAAQVTTTLAYLRASGMRPGDRVQMGLREISFSKLGGWLALGKDELDQKPWGERA